MPSRLPALPPPAPKKSLDFVFDEEEQPLSASILVNDESTTGRKENQGEISKTNADENSGEKEPSGSVQDNRGEKEKSSVRESVNRGEKEKMSANQEEVEPDQVIKFIHANYTRRNFSKFKNFFLSFYVFVTLACWDSKCQSKSANKLRYSIIY